MEAALSFVGGQFLSPLCQWIFDKLESCLQSKLNQNPEAMDKLEKWKVLLPKIQAMLDQETASDSHLKYLAYDMEDVLDEVEFQVKTQLQVAQSGARSSSSSTPPPSKRARTESSSLDLDSLLPKMNDITIKLEQIESNANLPKSISDSETGSLQQSTTSTGVRRRPETTSLRESHVYGREEERQAVLNHLLEREGDQHPHNVTVISLVGMGGIGKTTLARLLYNDDNVKKAEFHLRAWVCVSDDYDLQTLTKRILEAVTQQEPNVNSLDLLQTKLKDALARKKFLLVLDDVWNLNGQLWEILSKPFLHGAPGSKIIVTTRDRGVASVMTIQGYAIDQPYILTALSNNDCMQLFSRHAIQADNFDECSDLKPMAEEIVRRCRGLPLAAKTLGGLLCGKRGRRDWEQLLNSKIWDLPQEKSDVLPALRLSYYHLRSQLKCCFTYCALFPKDYEFDEVELVLYWMAEGFLKQTNGNMTMEELGHQYFDELLSKGFLQPSNADVSKFVMHDLIHDLALSVDRNTCFYLPEGIEVDGSQATWDKVCHISFACSRGRRHKYQKFEFLHKTKRLRTFIALHFPRRSWMDNYLSSRVLDELLPELKCLRVLSLRSLNIGNVPSGIGGMKHLRHLDLSHTQIRLIPESVSELIFLQTVLAEGCTKLTALPYGIGNLIDLHHLDISGTGNLKDMPVGIYKLKNLQTLSRFMVSKEAGGLSLRHLKDLTNLRGKLSIENVENVENVQDAEEANLKTKKDLKQLILQWYVPYGGFTSPEIINKQMQVLNHLHPHQNMENFTVDGYSGTETPLWMDELSFFYNISFLELCHCENWASLPSVGRLPSLKELIIENMAAVQVIGVEFLYGNDIGVSCGSFKALEKLSICNMPAWEVWFCGNGCGDECHKMFPKLSQLTIFNCPRLVGNIPSCNSTLRELIIYDCPKLRVSIGSLPSLEKLEIQECRGVIFKDTVDLNSLTSFTIKQVHEQVNIAADESPQMLPKLCELRISNCPYLIGNIPSCHSTLRKFIVYGCPEFRVSIGCLPSLEELEIHKCKGIIFKDMVDLSSLTSLTIKQVHEQVRAVDEAFAQVGNGLIKVDVDTKSLNLLMDSNWWKVGMRHLKHLSISRAPSFLNEVLHFNSNSVRFLKRLGIHRFESIESILLGNLPATIESIDIQGCNDLRGFHGAPPTTLKELTISFCDHPFSEGIPGTLKHLSVSYCPDLESLAGNTMFLTNLEQLVLRNCENLKWLPDEFHQLASLKTLDIKWCPSIERFPEGGLPLNLEELKVDCVNMKQAMTEWGLDRLHSLKVFEVHHQICPPDGELLPPSLTSLKFCGVMELKSISKDLLRNLTALEKLGFSHCPELKSISKDLLRNLTALKSLSFHFCRELSYFPKDLYLPPTLERLVIVRCPDLKNKCGYKGEYWHLLADIPHLMIR